MDLFGMNRFAGGLRNSPQRGPARFFQTFWDNMGGLLAGNLLTFLGFLPLALGVSLGLVYENAWITLLAGGLGGAVAGVFWMPMLSLSVQALRGGTRGWFRRWRYAVGKGLAISAGTGVILGLVSGGLLSVGGFAGGVLGNHPPLLVWVILGLDFLVLSLAAALIFPALYGGRGQISPTALWKLFAASPRRAWISAVGTLLWCALLVALFPVSVPFAAVVGFWPLSLFTAQMMHPAMETAYSLPAPLEESVPRETSAARQRGEIFWRRRWPAVVILTAVFGLLLWGGSGLLFQREPDIQIAVIHAEPLPDGVRSSLEDSLTALIGDRNGDGKALAQVNDYTVVFDGSAADSDMQTAGSTLLVTDIAAGVSAFYIVEDVQGFLERYADQVDAGRSILWKNCPTLTALDAGSYAVLEDIAADLSGQDLLAPLTVLPNRSAEDGLLKTLLN